MPDREDRAGIGFDRMARIEQWGPAERQWWARAEADYTARRENRQDRGAAEAEVFVHAWDDPASWRAFHREWWGTSMPLNSDYEAAGSRLVSSRQAPAAYEADEDLEVLEPSDRGFTDDDLIVEVTDSTISEMRAEEHATRAGQAVRDLEAAGAGQARLAEARLNAAAADADLHAAILEGAVVRARRRSYDARDAVDYETNVRPGYQPSGQVRFPSPALEDRVPLTEEEITATETRARQERERAGKLRAAARETGSTPDDAYSPEAWSRFDNLPKAALEDYVAITAETARRAGESEKTAQDAATAAQAAVLENPGDTDASAFAAILGRQYNDEIGQSRRAAAEAANARTAYEDRMTAEDRVVRDAEAVVNPPGPDVTPASPGQDEFDAVPAEELAGINGDPVADARATVAHWEHRLDEALDAEREAAEAQVPDPEQQALARQTEAVRGYLADSNETLLDAEAGLFEGATTEYHGSQSRLHGRYVIRVADRGRFDLADEGGHVVLRGARRHSLTAAGREEEENEAARQWGEDRGRLGDASLAVGLDAVDGEIAAGQEAEAGFDGRGPADDDPPDAAMSPQSEAEYLTDLAARFALGDGLSEDERKALRSDRGRQAMRELADAIEAGEHHEEPAGGSAGAEIRDSYYGITRGGADEIPDAPGQEPEGGGQAESGLDAADLPYAAIDDETDIRQQTHELYMDWLHEMEGEATPEWRAEQAEQDWREAEWRREAAEMEENDRILREMEEEDNAEAQAALRGDISVNDLSATGRQRYDELMREAERYLEADAENGQMVSEGEFTAGSSGFSAAGPWESPAETVTRIDQVLADGDRGETVIAYETDPRGLTLQTDAGRAAESASGHYVEQGTDRAGSEDRSGEDPGNIRTINGFPVGVYETPADPRAGTPVPDQPELTENPAGRGGTGYNADASLFERAAAAAKLARETVARRAARQRDRRKARSRDRNRDRGQELAR